MKKEENKDVEAVVFYRLINETELQDVIQCLDEKKPVLLSLEAVDLEVGQRLMETLLIYMSESKGRIMKVSGFNYFLLPEGVNVEVNME